MIHPFASLPEKPGPPNDSSKSRGTCATQTGWIPVFLAGPSDDPAPFSEFRVLRNARWPR